MKSIHICVGGGFMKAEREKEKFRRGAKFRFLVQSVSKILVVHHKSSKTIYNTQKQNS